MDCEEFKNWLQIGTCWNVCRCFAPLITRYKGSNLSRQQKCYIISAKDP